MLSKVLKTLERWDRRVRRSFGKDISTPSGRRAAWLHYLVFDHAFLRMMWTNFYPVADGVWRSNQPTHTRFERYAKMGIKTVLNLRGEDDQAHYLFEKESLDALGIRLINVKLYARNTSGAQRILDVIDAFRTMEKPFLLHCKSGADRAGLASAIYQMVIEGKPVEEARKQLGVKFIHLKWTKTGVLDYMLDVYQARNEHDPISFEDWVRTEYDPRALQEAYDSGHRVALP